MGYKFNPFTRQLDSTADAGVIEQSITNSTTINNIIDGSGWQLPGPYVNEGAAATGGVAIGQAYYDNGGTVRVRLA